MKVIFLDIDGVLNIETYRENPEVNYFENPISEVHMHLLAYLVKQTGAEVVLSSTWREYWECGEKQSDPFGIYINNLFEKYGLAIFDKTPEFRDRDDEISEWLKLHEGQIENYVIIDDFDFEWSDKNEKHLIKTKDETGLDEETVARAIRILNDEEGLI